MAVLRRSSARPAVSHCRRRLTSHLANCSDLHGVAHPRRPSRRSDACSPLGAAPRGGLSFFLQQPVNDIPRVGLIPALGWRSFRRPRRLWRLRTGRFKRARWDGGVSSRPPSFGDLQRRRCLSEASQTIRSCRIASFGLYSQQLGAWDSLADLGKGVVGTAIRNDGDQ